MKINSAEIQFLGRVLNEERERLEGIIISVEQMEKKGPVTKASKDVQLKCLYDLRTLQDLSYKVEKEDLAR